MVSIWINLFEESLNWFKIESFDLKLFCNFAEIVINIPKNDSDIQRKLRLSGCFIVCYLATWRHINFFLTCNEHSFSIRPSSNSIFAATPRILSSSELFLVKEKEMLKRLFFVDFSSILKKPYLETCATCQLTITCSQNLLLLYCGASDASHQFTRI